MSLGSQRDVDPRTFQNHFLQQLECVQASKHTAWQVRDLVAIEDPGEKVTERQGQRAALPSLSRALQAHRPFTGSLSIHMVTVAVMSLQEAGDTLTTRAGMQCFCVYPSAHPTPKEVHRCTQSCLSKGPHKEVIQSQIQRRDSLWAGRMNTFSERHREKIEQQTARER